MGYVSYRQRGADIELGEQTMLKELLAELRTLIEHLEDSRYFDKPKTQNTSKTRKAGYEHKAKEKGRKLTRADVLDIYKEDRMTYVDIAEIYGITPSTVSHIKTGRIWWKVTGAPRRKPARQHVLPDRAVSTGL